MSDSEKSESKSQDPQTISTSSILPRKDLLKDVAVMVDYVTGNGVNLDTETRELVSALEARIAENSRTAAEVSIDTRSVVAKLTSRLSDAELLLKTHQSLVEKISPITPSTLQSTYWENRCLRWITFLGGFSILTILFSAFFEETSLDLYNYLDALSIAAAAILGSAFYSLFTASYYLKRRLYDKNYDQTYLLRFVLGVLAGSILGIFAPSLLTEYPETVAQVGQTTLGLVGGFSAEAVLRILQRFSDTLVTLVSGNDRQAVEAEKSKARTEADIQIQKERVAVLSEVEAILDDADLGESTAAIQSIRKALRERL